MTTPEQIEYWRNRVADNRDQADRLRGYLGIDAGATARLTALDREWEYYTQRLNELERMADEKDDR